jgi:hypothetical protein
MPGTIVTNGGDIDNRIKVLFDALCIPMGKHELGGAMPQDGEDPFYVLLEDDRLITRIGVTTDQLLIPVSLSGNVNDVVLVLTVKTGFIDFHGLM